MSFSPDGRWWWDGRSWVAATSPDGKWRWNGADWAPSSGKAGGPSPLRAIFGIGPILAGLAAGAAFWITTNDIPSTVVHAALTWAGLAFVRLVDPLLSPLWRLLAFIPGIVRWLLALAVAAWFSIGQFGPAAAYHEVDHFQAALYVSIAIAYVLIRPSRGVRLK